MMTRRVSQLAASVACALVSTVLVGSPAAAQTPAVAAQTTTAQTTAPPALTAEPDRFTVTAFIGPGFGGGLQGNALDLGVAAGYNFTTRVGVEGEFAYARNSNQGLIDTSSNTQTYSANVLYHFPVSNWLPYGTFGIGALHGSAEVTAPVSTAIGGQQQLLNTSQSNTDFGFNLGAGVKRRISDNVRFRGDLRFFDGGDLPNFWRVYGGLTFLLGSR